MPFKLGPWELGLLLAMVIIIFGVGKLPQVGGAIGKSIRQFRRAQAEVEAVEAEKPESGKRIS